MGQAKGTARARLMALMCIVQSFLTASIFTGNV
jgi:hypothetical protein